MTTQANILIYQGTSFVYEVETDLDLTLFQAEASFAKSSYPSAIRYSCTTDLIEPDSNNPNWRVVISLIPGDTLGLEPTYYVFNLDVFRLDSNYDTRTRLLEGVIDLRSKV